MIETYKEVIEFLYARLPMFTRDGATAIKKDVDNTLQFCKALGNPHKKFKSIHIAGTNGKGSTSHMLASVLASAGYKTGLYTSPHLVDFRERIRINGNMIPQERVTDFVNKHLSLIEDIKPSFFETTVAMAFDYFAAEEVDVAIVEVGLGGRLDSTNILLPELCLITNIGMDHTDLLGNTLAEIAAEKAGIIKAAVPVILSERDESIVSVFEEKAHQLQAPLRFASREWAVRNLATRKEGLVMEIVDLRDDSMKELYVGLSGRYQQKNILGVLTAVDELRKQGWSIDDKQLQEGLAQVVKNTGLQGRWQTLSTDPLIICDTGHNEDGIREVIENIKSTAYRKLHIVIGAMRDKDLGHILPLLPTDAIYYFCNPAMPRAMPAKELKETAGQYNLRGKAYPSVADALRGAKAAYQDDDLIFVGGSNFVVADVLQAYL